MPCPLPCNKNRHLDMECEYNLLKWRCMVISHQIVDKTFILSVCLRALSIADSGTLHYALIRTKIIYQPDKPMIENRILLSRISSASGTMQCITPPKHNPCGKAQEACLRQQLSQSAEYGRQSTWGYNHFR